MSRSIPLLNLLRKALFGLLLGWATLSSQAQMAQKPLLTQSGLVEPNVLLILDESLSMNEPYIYQYGTNDNNGYGQMGPTRHAINRRWGDDQFLFARCQPHLSRSAQILQAPHQHQWHLADRRDADCGFRGLFLSGSGQWHSRPAMDR